MEQESQIGDKTYNSAEPSQLKYPLDPVTRRMVQEDTLVFRSINGSVLSVDVNGINYNIETGSQTKYKAATETITSNATPQNDNDLFFTLDTDTTYSFQGYIHINSPAAAGFKMIFSEPTGAVFSWNYLSGEVDYNETSAVVNISTFDANVTVSVTFTGTITTSSTAGDLQLQWSQTTSNVGNTSVLSGSWMTIKKLS